MKPRLRTMVAVRSTNRTAVMSKVWPRYGCHGGRRKGGWICAEKRHVSPALVVIGRESGSGRISKGPVLTKDEYWGCEIEIAEGVMISTPYAMHLVGLLHQGSPATFLHPSTSLDEGGARYIVRFM